MNANLKSKLQAISELARKEDYLEAIRRVDQLIMEYPAEPWTWKTRAYVNSRQGNENAAIADLTNAIERSDKEPDFYYSRGVIMFQEGRYREAVEDFTRVIYLSDLHEFLYYREEAYFFRADSYVRLKEFARAKDDCLHVRDGMRTWTDGLRTKADILADCAASHIDR
jgi:tetratricopeptide (TPR) repeat protein